jgi:class 3 adenylate cyclase
VLDAGTAGLTGGTAETVAHWRGSRDSVDVIDLAALRRVAGIVADPVGPADVSAIPPRADAIAPEAAPRRELRSMLFADVAGYSRLREAQLPRFQHLFWTLAAAELAAVPSPARLANTGGDALVAVFDDAGGAAFFALRLRAAFAALDWSAAGIREPLAIRIGLHAAPVFAGFDPVIGRRNYFGAGVTRAARIEPVTPPGLVYASEAFAATLAARVPGCVLEYVGVQALAKHYGESRLYRLEGLPGAPGASGARME